MSHRGMNHQQAQEELVAYVDARLSDIERAALERHLTGCAACQRELADLQAAHAWLGQSISTVASSAAAPSDAWAHFESRLGQPSFERRQSAMEQTSRRTRPPMGLIMGLAAAAAAIVLVGIGIAAMVLLNGNQDGQVAVIPASNTPSATATGEVGFPAPGSTFLPTPTLTDLEAYMTQRPQSGGGSGQPDGGNGGSAPYWQGLVQAVDPAAGTITLDSGQVARIMPFTVIRIEDITWDGALGTVTDIQIGEKIQIDLLDAEPSPPYANVIWLQRPVENFFAEMDYELNMGTISTLDPATGIFTVNVWESEILFQYNADTRLYIDDDTFDGTSITAESLQVGQAISFVSLPNTGNPRPVVQIIVEPPTPDYMGAYEKGTITAIDGRNVTISTVSGQVHVVDIGAPEYAASQGITFAVGDVVVLNASIDFENNYAWLYNSIIKLATGQQLILRDATGSRIP